MRIIDKKVGLIYYGLCAIIIGYVSLYVLMYNQEYYTKEKTIGVASI